MKFSELHAQKSKYDALLIELESERKICEILKNILFKETPTPDLNLTKLLLDRFIEVCGTLGDMEFEIRKLKKEYYGTI